MSRWLGKKPDPYVALSWRQPGASTAASTGGVEGTGVEGVGALEEVWTAEVSGVRGCPP